MGTVIVLIDPNVLSCLSFFFLIHIVLLNFIRDYIENFTDLAVLFWFSFINCLVVSLCFCFVGGKMGLPQRRKFRCLTHLIKNCFLLLK